MLFEFSKSKKKIYRQTDLFIYEKRRKKKIVRKLNFLQPQPHPFLVESASTSDDSDEYEDVDDDDDECGNVVSFQVRT